MSTQIVAPERPYKFLDYYDYQDSSIFKGRATEIEILLSDIVTARLVVLFAPTGCGKSSLINAGVRPRLEELDYRTFYIRVERDPIRSCREVLRQNHVLLDETTSSFAAALAEAAARRPIVLFFDQFEEFFIYVAKEQPAQAAAFIAAVGALHRNRTSGVHIVFSLREEFFVHMNAFRGEVPSIFHNDSNLQLKWFNDIQARDVIKEPGLAFGVAVDDALVDRLIADLRRADGIEPAGLQIVCDTLWNHVEDRRITLATYETLGGASEILNRRLEEDVSRTLDDDGLELFERIVPWLSTEHGTKTIQPIDELTSRVDAKRDDVVALVDRLAQLRLVRITTRESANHVEWTTDYLSDPKRAGDWRVRVRALRLARSLAKAMTAKRISPEALNDLSAGMSLLTLNEAQITFLFDAALSSGQNMTTWLQRAQAAGLEVWHILGSYIPGDLVRARNALFLMSGLDDVEAARLAGRAVEHPPLAHAALVALETIARTGGQRSGAAAKAKTLLDEARKRQHESEVRTGNFSGEVARNIGDIQASRRDLLASPDITLSEADWHWLMERISSGRCTPVVGAGAAWPRTPLASEIAALWIKEYDAPLEVGSSLATVAQFMAVWYDPIFPKERLRQVLVERGADTRIPSSMVALADLPLEVYVNLAYDDSLERALYQAGKRPRRQLYHWNPALRRGDEDSSLMPTESAPIVFYLCGHMETPESLVLTEDDYIELLINVSMTPKALPLHVQKALASSTLLFMGHDFSDLLFRTLTRGLLAAVARTLRGRSVAVMDRPEDKAHAKQRYIERYLVSLDSSVYWGHSEDFTSELRARLKLRL
jgi:hypothetical protein